jgi:hypothetical protein
VVVSTPAFVDVNHLVNPKKIFFPQNRENYLWAFEVVQLILCGCVRVQLESVIFSRTKSRKINLNGEPDRKSVV